MILYCDAKNHTIEDDKGNVVTLEQAKEICKSGKLKDCNLSFQRLVNYEFNWQILDDFYRENL